MFEWLERWTRSAYLRSLEDEVKRLLDENRQLVNALLTAQGMTRIVTPQERQEQENRKPPVRRVPWNIFAARKEAESNARLRQEVQLREKGAIKPEGQPS